MSNTPYELFGVECGEGWKSLYSPIIRAAEDQGVSVFQVKEKFGGLRIYLGAAPDWLHDMCEIVEGYSTHVCELCGKSGEVRTNKGWISTLCDRCVKEVENE